MSGIPGGEGVPSSRNLRVIGWLGILGGAILLANVALGYLTFLSILGWFGSPIRTEAFLAFALCSGAAAWGPGIVALVLGYQALHGRGTGRAFLILGCIALFGSVLLLLALIGTLLGIAAAALLLVAGVLGHDSRAVPGTA